MALYAGILPPSYLDHFAYGKQAQDWGGNDEFGTRVKEVAWGWPNLEELAASGCTSLGTNTS
jgi:hypothetical protein